jgi:hypothetical protein
MSSLTSSKANYTAGYGFLSTGTVHGHRPAKKKWKIFKLYPVETKQRKSPTAGARCRVDFDPKFSWWHVKCCSITDHLHTVYCQELTECHKGESLGAASEKGRQKVIVCIRSDDLFVDRAAIFYTA